MSIVNLSQAWKLFWTLIFLIRIANRRSDSISWWWHAWCRWSPCFLCKNTAVGREDQTSCAESAGHEICCLLQITTYYYYCSTNVQAWFWREATGNNNSCDCDCVKNTACDCDCVKENTAVRSFQTKEKKTISQMWTLCAQSYNYSTTAACALKSPKLTCIQVY